MVEDEAKKIQRRPAKKVTKTRLKNIGLYYLERFESSVDNLRQVLTKRVNDYAFQNPGYDKSEALGWIEELLADFERYGYLNDSRYAELKIRDYLAAGKSARYIKGKLLQKGIGEDEAERLLAEQDYNLSVSTYVEQEDTREVIDIQKLNAEIAQIVAREQKLREEIDKIVAEIEGGNENE